MARKQITVWKCECDKCGHIWVSKNQIIPAMCAKCRTVTWDRGKVESEDNVVNNFVKEKDLPNNEISESANTKDEYFIEEREIVPFDD